MIFVIFCLLFFVQFCCNPSKSYQFSYYELTNTMKTDKNLLQKEELQLDKYKNHLEKLKNDLAHFQQQLNEISARHTHTTEATMPEDFTSPMTEQEIQALLQHNTLFSENDTVVLHQARLEVGKDNTVYQPTVWATFWQSCKEKIAYLLKIGNKTI
jgi:arsenate reductase-like glutaredoxin family protein